MIYLIGTRLASFYYVGGLTGGQITKEKLATLTRPESRRHDQLFRKAKDKAPAVSSNTGATSLSTK